MNHGHIVLGLGNTVDYELVWDSVMMGSLINKYEIAFDEINSHPTYIETERDLLLSILYFFKNGLGGECFILNPEVLDTFVSHFLYEVTLGGSGLRAALAMDRLGINSLVHLVSRNKETLELLPESIGVICDEGRESLYPHIIIQYSKGDTLKIGNGFIETNTSNRLIYNHDKDVIDLPIATQLSQIANEVSILVISGFNAMQDKDTLKSRLSEIISIIICMPQNSFIFYEDACFHDKALALDVASALAPYISVYSLNTDEFQDYLGFVVDLTNPKEIYDGMLYLKSLINCDTIVLHSKYWALAYGECASKYQNPLEKGVALASARFCYGDVVTKQTYENMLKRKKDSLGMNFCNAMNVYPGVCAVAVPDVLEDPVTTIGLGDTFVGGFLAGFIDNEL